MLPSNTDLEYFLELYNIKNISRASERLGITQPSLSVSLKRLEEAFGFQLFIRSKAGVTPTKEADLLIKDVEKLLNDWGRIGAKARDVTQNVKGRVRFGCHSSVALYAVSPWIKKISLKHPELEFSFSHDLSRKILEQVVSFKLDVALVINPAPHPDLVILPLLKDEVTFRKAKGKKVDTSTLIYDPSLIQAQTLLKTLKKKKIRFSKEIITSSLELVEQLTSNGVGVGVLPKRVCKNVQMEEFNKALKPFKDELCLVYRADVPKTKSFEVVVSAIKEALKS